MHDPQASTPGGGRFEERENSSLVASTALVFAWLCVTWRIAGTTLNYQNSSHKWGAAPRAARRPRVGGWENSFFHVVELVGRAGTGGRSPCNQGDLPAFAKAMAGPP